MEEENKEESKLTPELLEFINRISEEVYPMPTNEERITHLNWCSVGRLSKNHV